LEKITGRINSWLSRHLSFAGRLQVVSSVLYSVQVYWISIFILPKKITRAIEKKKNSIDSFSMVGMNGYLEPRFCGVSFVYLK